MVIESASRVRSRGVLLAAIALCAACTVGPEPRRPDETALAAWAASRDPVVTSDLPSRVVVGRAVEERWWSAFGDPLLDGLIDDAMVQNLDVRQAALRIAEARAQRESAVAAGLPSAEVSNVAARSRMSENGIGQALSGGGSSGGASSTSSAPPSTFNLFQAGFDATWELDLFGKVRRNVQAAGFDIESAEEARHDALVSMAAEIARAYLTMRGYELQRDITLADIADQERLRDLVDSRNRAGLVASSDVLAQRVQVSATRAQLPPLDQGIAVGRNRLALLLALPPGALDARLGGAIGGATLPRLPPEVPVGLPGDLLRRRPDIRRREADVQAATARIGVATASLFPTVRLGAVGGFQSTQGNSLFDWASHFGIGGAQLSLPLFEGGRLRAQVRLANLREEEAVLTYRQAVLGAYHDADNALVTYAQDQRRTVDLDRQVGEARHSRALAEDRYRSGLGAYIDVLNAEHQARQATLDLARSNVTASTDLIALFKALGGGWAAADQRR